MKNLHPIFEAITLAHFPELKKEHEVFIEDENHPCWDANDPRHYCARCFEGGKLEAGRICIACETDGIEDPADNVCDWCSGTGQRHPDHGGCSECGGTGKIYD